jgi:hypothetical protein
MKALWLGIVVVLVCVVPVWGQQGVVFYDGFESGDTAGWWAPARVGETGQVTCFDEEGFVIACAGTGQNGDLQSGVAWPRPRFLDNGDGTVTDMMTGLIWLKNANCFGDRTWAIALADANTLADSACGLTDGSVAGDWRLPSVNELQSLVDYEYLAPALSNAAGTGHWTEGDAFFGVQGVYWSSTSCAFRTDAGWLVALNYGFVTNVDKTFPPPIYIWPVRGGL